jgi:coproporphyrinogen III oxidase
VTVIFGTHIAMKRGVGGLFLIIAKQTKSNQDWFNFVSEVGDSFLEAYVPIVEKRKVSLR